MNLIRTACTEGEIAIALVVKACPKISYTIAATGSTQDEPAWHTSDFHSLITLAHCKLRGIATATFLHPTIAAEVPLHILASAATRTTLMIRSQEGLVAVATTAIGGDKVFLFRNASGERAEAQPANYYGAGEHESDL